ncbi:hypothetical protein C8R45DRAFT_811576, partial [Mycena sanguinolenta]
LLCMARALPKKSKILLMDEVVDYATDELIGKTISEEFAYSAMLTIAHRICSVVAYDKVMVLDQGNILVPVSPVHSHHRATLLANPSSKFYALCKATGSHEFQMLKKLAGL